MQHIGVKYRPDIDGLRALAVLPVVFYHFGIKYMPGGFVGVDVFFVISGYLITQVIYADLKAGTYSISRFYERRIRRILPAFVFVAACTAGVMAVYGLPDDIKSFRNGLLTATLFSSNVYFYLSTDYFVAAAETQPLLHTWSLGVEEQFYIVFPLLLWLLRRYSHRRVAACVLLGAGASLAISALLVTHDRPAAFYLLHSRAWELLLGSFLAICPIPIESRRVNEAIGVAGLGCILYGIFRFNSGTPFPGLAALSPCLGAGMIILSGSNSVVGKLLGMSPIRFIGLISYSLYLWHWPIWVLATSYLLLDLTHATKVVLFLLSLGLATFSWWFVERPFRIGSFRPSARKLFWSSGFALCFMVVAALSLGPINARIWHFTPDVQKTLAVATDLSDRNMRVGQCFLSSNFNDFSGYDKTTCLGLSSEKRNYLLIGDSHAAHLWAGLAAVNPEINFLQATASGCKPIIGSKGEERCTRLMEFVFRDFLPSHHLDGIVISGRWGDQDVDGALSTAQALEAYADHVIIFGPTVEYRTTLPNLAAWALLEGNKEFASRYRSTKQAGVDTIFQNRLRASGIRYFSVYHALCSKFRCQTLDDQDLPIAFDYGHFTTKGSILVAQKAKSAGMFAGTSN